MTQSDLIPIQIMFLGVIPLATATSLWFFWWRYRRFVRVVQSHDEQQLIELYRKQGIETMTLPMSSGANNPSFTAEPGAHHFLAQQKYATAFDELTKHPARQPKTYFEEKVTTDDLEKYIRYVAEEGSSAKEEQRTHVYYFGTYRGQAVEERYQATLHRELLKVLVATKGFIPSASEFVDYNHLAQMATELIPEEARKTILAPGIAQYATWFERVSSPTYKPGVRLIGFTIALIGMTAMCMMIGVLLTIPAVTEQLFAIE